MTNNTIGSIDQDSMWELLTKIPHDNLRKNYEFFIKYNDKLIPARLYWANRRYDYPNRPNRDLEVCITYCTIYRNKLREITEFLWKSNDVDQSRLVMFPKQDCVAG